MYQLNACLGKDLFGRFCTEPLKFNLSLPNESCFFQSLRIAGMGHYLGNACELSFPQLRPEFIIYLAGMCNTEKISSFDEPAVDSPAFYGHLANHKRAEFVFKSDLRPVAAAESFRFPRPANSWNIKLLGQ